MANGNGNEPKQKTQPHPKPDGTVAEPTDIPVPKRGDFFRDLGKVAKPRKKDSPGEGGPEDQV
jgi:hypothetical protein